MLSIFKKKPSVSQADQQKITSAIGAAEKETTGEIRVFIENKCPEKEPLVRAKQVFAQLDMHKTEARNAIIIYVALQDRKFALFGDKAIYELAGGPVFWEAAADELKGHLKRNELADGIANCIKKLGAALAQQFPASKEANKNELPDDIVFGN